jgi:hypothetical protein
MPSNTTYYNLWIFDPSTDTSSTFLTFRSDVAGTAGGSNMIVLDAALHTHDTQIAALQTVRGIIYVPLLFQSANFFTATGVSGITSYADGLVIDAALDQDCTGTVTININSLGTKSLVKYNSTGSATVNLSSGDMKKNKHYLFRYSLSLDVFIWINSTAGDQVNVVGTSGNFVSLTSTGVLQDSAVNNGLLTHLAGTETLTGAKTFNLPPNYVTQSISTTALLSSASAPIVLIDTTSAGFTLTLPASPVTGEWFIFIDSTAQWATHNLTINPNSKNIDGSSSNVVLNSNNFSYEIYYDGSAWHSKIRAASSDVNTGTDNYKPITPGALRGSVVNVPADGQGTNYQITSSIASNNLTVALKGIDGNDPSATNPILFRIGNTRLTLTSALSVTITAALGDIFTWDSRKIQGYDTQVFIYMINNNGTPQLGISPSPTLTTVATTFYDSGGQTGSVTQSNIVMSGTRNATNGCGVIGRLQVQQLDNNNWTTPTTSNIVNYPIWETDFFQYLPTYGTSNFNPTLTTTLLYRVKRSEILFQTFNLLTTGGTSNNKIGRAHV